LEGGLPWLGSQLGFLPGPARRPAWSKAALPASCPGISCHGRNKKPVCRQFLQALPGSINTEGCFARFADPTKNPFSHPGHFSADTPPQIVAPPATMGFLSRAGLF